MDPLRAELIGPLVVTEMQREAQRQRLVVAARAGAAPGWSPIVELGRLLVRVGSRLEAIGRPRPIALPLTAVTEACGCGN